MPTFKADWTKAKTAFQQTTSAKKPSASFLGFFNKGSGIGSALEKCDKAKNAGELYEGMKAFKKAYDDYIITLDKAIADPKVTPTADKPTYAQAVTKLKADLLTIYNSAGKTAQAIVGSRKSELVDAARLRAKTEQVPTQGAKYRDVAKEKFHQSRKLLLSMVKANPQGLTKDNFENAENSIKDMTKFLKTLEDHAKKKTMTEQFAKFEVEWANAEAGKGMGQVEHYLVKMGATEFGMPDVKK